MSDNLKQHHTLSQVLLSSLKLYYHDPTEDIIYSKEN